MKKALSRDPADLSLRAGLFGEACVVGQKLYKEGARLVSSFRSLESRSSSIPARVIPTRICSHKLSTYSLSFGRIYFFFPLLFTLKFFLAGVLGAVDHWSVRLTLPLIECEL